MVFVITCLFLQPPVLTWKYAMETSSTLIRAVWSMLSPPVSTTTGLKAAVFWHAPMEDGIPQYQDVQHYKMVRLCKRYNYIIISSLLILYVYTLVVILLWRLLYIIFSIIIRTFPVTQVDLSDVWRWFTYRPSILCSTNKH